MSWTLRNTGARPVTLNALAQMHRMTWATHTRVTRNTWAVIARDAAVPHLEACSIEATPLHRDRRSPQDVGAAAPSVKAAVDGLVDAGVLNDDGPSYVVAITYLPPRVCGEDGLELVIYPIVMNS